MITRKLNHKTRCIKRTSSQNNNHNLPLPNTTHPPTFFPLCLSLLLHHTYLYNVYHQHLPYHHCNVYHQHLPCHHLIYLTLTHYILALLLFTHILRLIPHARLFLLLLSHRYHNIIMFRRILFLST